MTPEVLSGIISAFSGYPALLLIVILVGGAGFILFKVFKGLIYLIKESNSKIFESIKEVMVELSEIKDKQGEHAILLVSVQKDIERLNGTKLEVVPDRQRVKRK